MNAQGKERWEIDGSHSQLSFSLRHIVVSQIEGHFRSWGGEMMFDPDYVPRTQIQVWVDLGSIDTGAADRDAHVRSAEFLDTTRFPRAQFTSTDVALGRDFTCAATPTISFTTGVASVDSGGRRAKRWPIGGRPPRLWRTNASFTTQTATLSARS